jgi:hypothetical protein
VQQQVAGLENVSWTCQAKTAVTDDIICSGAANIKCYSLNESALVREPVSDAITDELRRC